MSTTTESDYNAACREATTAQGLDPVVEALEDEGIDYRVDQTGGWTMVVVVPLADGAWLGINEDGVPGDGWFVCHYMGEEDAEGEEVTRDGGVEHVQAEVAVALYAAGVRENGDPVAVAFCEDGECFGEMVELAEHVLDGVSFDDVALTQAAQASFARYQERLREELEEARLDCPLVAMPTANHGDFSVSADDLAVAWVTYAGRSAEELRAIVEDRLDGEDWSDIDDAPVFVIVLAALDVELEMGAV
jgi:hypothetical protein